MKWWVVIGVLLLAAALIPSGGRFKGVHIGSKKSTEPVILGEMMQRLAESTGAGAIHHAELGGTRVLYDSLVGGELDAYLEYSGTIDQEILAGEEVGEGGVEARLLADGVRMSRPLGFNNSYALALKREKAEQLGLEKISDLARYPELRMGFSNEFMDRDDGWPSLRREYGLAHPNVVGLDHDLAYRQIDTDVIDVIDAYTTDAKLRVMDLALLEDDREFFPRYDAVILYRADLEDRYPKVVEAIRRLEGRFTDERMIQLNAGVEIENQSEARVAADFILSQLDVSSEVADLTPASRIAQHTWEHLDLVRRSLIPAIFCAIPLGIFAAKRPAIGQVVLGAVGIVQTIPALALLVLLMAPIAKLGYASIGVGSTTAVVALFLYSLLPIVRNTAAGVAGIAPVYHEISLALGISPWYRLLRIELPLALPSILAGVKTAAVLNVGFATLGALIGAGGYGQPIITGIRRNDPDLIMMGAIPAAAMAIVFQIGFELAERRLLPLGVRLSGSK